MVESQDQDTPPVAPEPGWIARLKERTERWKTEGLDLLEVQRERHRSVQTALDLYTRDRAFAGSLLAGGLSVKVFLWFLPFSLSFVVTLGWVSDLLGRPSEELVAEAGLAVALARMIRDSVNASSRGRIYLAVLGVSLMIWAGIGVVRALRLVSRLAWDMTATRPINTVAGSAAFIGLVVSLLLVQGLSHLLLSGPFLTDLLVLVGTVVATAAILVSFLHMLPSPDGVPRTAMIPGAMLMAIGFLLIRLVTILYFSPRLDSAGDLYGGLGAAGVFLAWLYVISRATVAAISLNATAWRGSHDGDTGPTPG